MIAAAAVQRLEDLARSCGSSALLSSSVRTPSALARFSSGGVAGDPVSRPGDAGGLRTGPRTARARCRAQIAVQDAAADGPAETEGSPTSAPWPALISAETFGSPYGVTNSGWPELAWLRSASHDRAAFAHRGCAAGQAASALTLASRAGSTAQVILSRSARLCEACDLTVLAVAAELRPVTAEDVSALPGSPAPAATSWPSLPVLARLCARARGLRSRAVVLPRLVQQRLIDQRPDPGDLGAGGGCWAVRALPGRHVGQVGVAVARAPGPGRSAPERPAGRRRRMSCRWRWP